MDGRDDIDRMLSEWSWSSYDLALRQMAVSKRISLVARRLEQLATDTLGRLGLDPGEFEVLAILLRNGASRELSPTALNRWLMISGGGLTKRLARLEERGLISRRLAPGDRRSLLVVLTDKGRSLAEVAVLAHSAATAELIDRIGPESREQLSGLLRDLILSLDAASGAGAPDAADAPEPVTG
jgi:DNA-binding MarR family transcriptional regulator